MVYDREKHNRDTTIFTTNKENVFICGDARRGQSLIKYAIGEGKLAAVAIRDAAFVRDPKRRFNQRRH